jgi:hypothetical protein
MEIEKTTPTIDAFKFENLLPEPTVRSRQKWDMLAIDSRDQEKILWALENHFEPFSSTTVPSQNKLSNQIEVAITIWFKRPAHTGEEDLAAPSKKDNVKNIFEK